MAEVDRRLMMSLLMQKINKDMGSQAIVYGSSNRAYGRRGLGRYSTGSTALDFALGGGLPAGLPGLFHGEESSGKTSTALRVVADAQIRCANCVRYIKDFIVKEEVDNETGEVCSVVDGYCDCVEKKLFVPPKKEKEKESDYLDRIEELKKNSFEETRVVYFDPEGSLDLEWADLLGVKLDLMPHMIGSNAEEVINACNQAINSKSVDLLVLDSIAALTPSKEEEVGAEEWQQGLGARLVNRYVRTSVCATARVKRITGRPTTQLWINQHRCKIGQFYGDNTTLPFGNAQLFHAATRVKFWSTYRKDNRREIFGSLSKNEKMTIASTVEQHFCIIKNKTGTAKGEGCFTVHSSGPRKGQVDEFNYIMHHAMRFGLLRKDGNKWLFGDKAYKTQKEAFEVARNPDIMASLRKEVMILMREELDGE